MPENNLDRILEEAERFMKLAEREFGTVGECLTFEEVNTHYLASINYGIRVLYQQNNAIIELLKKYENNVTKDL
ncbi:MAG: hypothetical protein AABX59_00605 [Nanoarchaeota archaeon]